MSTSSELESPHLHAHNLSLVFTNHGFPIEEWAFRNTLELTSILSPWREIVGSKRLHSPPPKSFPNHPFLLGESQTCPSRVLLEPSSSLSFSRLKHRSQNLLASNHGSSQWEESTFSFLASGWSGKWMKSKNISIFCATTISIPRLPCSSYWERRVILSTWKLIFYKHSKSLVPDYWFWGDGGLLKQGLTLNPHVALSLHGSELESVPFLLPFSKYLSWPPADDLPVFDFTIMSVMRLVETVFWIGEFSWTGGTLLQC